MHKFKFELHLIIVKVSNVLSFNLHLSGLKVVQATLNSLSTGADGAIMCKYFCAKYANCGSLLLLLSQNTRGFSSLSIHGSGIYS